MELNKRSMIEEINGKDSSNPDESKFMSHLAKEKVVKRNGKSKLLLQYGIEDIYHPYCTRKISSDLWCVKFPDIPIGKLHILIRLYEDFMNNIDSHESKGPEQNDSYKYVKNIFTGKEVKCGNKLKSRKEKSN